MSRVILKRRELLKGLGAAAFLGNPMFRESLAEAAGGAFPTRFIVLFFAGGPYYPTEREEPPATFTFDKLLAPLAPLQSEIIMFAGYNSDAGDAIAQKSQEPHAAGMRALLTGDSSGAFKEGTPMVWAPTDTVDQTIAAVIGKGVKFSSLQFGVSADRGAVIDQRRLIVKGAVAQPPVDNPATMFNRLFAGGVTTPAPAPTPAPGSGAAPPPPPPPANNADHRRSILDHLKSEITALKQVAGTREQQKLDQHMTSLRELEKQIVSSTPGTVMPPTGTTGTPSAATPAPVTPTMGCKSPAAPAAGGDIPTVLSLQLDMLYQSMACDLSRVSSLQFLCSAQSGVQFPWLGIKDDHHTMEHGQLNATLGANLNKVQTYFMEQAAGFLTRLKNTPEGNGSMLDNSLVLVCSELSNGEQHNHDFVGLTVGRAGGTVKPGRTIDGKGSPHNDVLMGLAAAFGINLTKIGDANLCKAPVLLG